MEWKHILLYFTESYSSAVPTIFFVCFFFIPQTACMMPRCSGLKKQKADASLIKTIIPAAAPSAIVRDRSNERKKESRRDVKKVAVCRYICSLPRELSKRAQPFLNNRAKLTFNSRDSKQMIYAG